MLRNKDARLIEPRLPCPGGKIAPYLMDRPAPEGQDEPTPALPVNAHKQMCGQGKVEKLPSFK